MPRRQDETVMDDANLNLCRAIAEAEGWFASTNYKVWLSPDGKCINPPNYLTDPTETLRMEDRLYKAGWRKCLAGDGVTYYFNAPPGVVWDHDQAPSAEVSVAVAEAYRAMLVAREE